VKRTDQQVIPEMRYKFKEGTAKGFSFGTTEREKKNIKTARRRVPMRIGDDVTKISINYRGNKLHVWGEH